MDFHCLWNVQDELIPYTALSYTTACLFIFFNNFLCHFNFNKCFCLYHWRIHTNYCWLAQTQPATDWIHMDTLDSFWNVGFLLGTKSTPTLLTCLTMQPIAIANGDWSTCNSRHLTTAVWKSTMRDKLNNNINLIIQHQNSQVINKIFAGKKQNAKKLKSVQKVLDNPDPAWAKMKSNPAPDPKKSHNSAGSDSKNPDPEQHCNLRLPWKQSFPWIHCIEYIFLSFRIFQQLALALKNRVALKMFTALKYFYYSGFLSNLRLLCKQTLP